MTDWTDVGARGRRLRRTALVGWGVAVLVLLLGSIASRENRGDPGSTLIAGYFLWLGSWAALRALTRGIADDPSGRLDEWELALRAKATRAGFFCFTVTTVAVATYLLVADGEANTAQRGGYLLLTAGLLSVSFPSAVLAHTLPSGALDEDDPLEPGPSQHP